MPAATEALPINDVLLCFHCGEQIPVGVELSIEIDGEAQPMCCPGCRAVAGLISTSGLDSFYQQRTAFNERPEQQEPLAREQYLIYDDAELAARESSSA